MINYIYHVYAIAIACVVYKIDIYLFTNSLYSVVENIILHSIFA